MQGHIIAEGLLSGYTLIGNNLKAIGIHEFSGVDVLELEDIRLVCIR